MPKRTAAEIWDAALGSLQVQVSATAYDTWLRGSRGQSFEHGAFTVAVSSAFVAEWLDRRMRSLIVRTLSDSVREPVQVMITVDTEPSTPHRVVQSALEPRRPMAAPQALPRTGYRPAAALGLHPRPDLTFSSFVVAANSKLAFAAAASVADRPATSYNPLVLHGSPGLGKTHLLHAIANAATPEHHTTVLMTAEHFVTEFVSSVRSRHAGEFQAQCRAADLFIIDDVQFICGKSRSEENFFHTCASLLRSGKQVVLAADRRLQELPFTHRALASQLQAGLTVDLQPPDQEARLAILAFKATRSPIPIPSEVLHYLAGRPSASVRAMEGELTRIIALATLTDQPLTLPLAVQALTKTGLPQSREARPLSAAALLVATASVFHVHPSALTGRSRERTLTHARHVAMYMLRQHTNLSLEQIGRLTGGRDHTTVLHGVNKITRLLGSDGELSTILSTILSTASTTSTPA